VSTSAEILSLLNELINSITSLLRIIDFDIIITISLRVKRHKLG